MKRKTLQQQVFDLKKEIEDLKSRLALIEITGYRSNPPFDPRPFWEKYPNPDPYGPFKPRPNKDLYPPGQDIWC